jgi:hypothetical protein
VAGRGNLVAYQCVMRLLRFARNDNTGGLQRSQFPPEINSGRYSSAFWITSQLKPYLVVIVEFSVYLPAENLKRPFNRIQGVILRNIKYWNLF